MELLDKTLGHLPKLYLVIPCYNEAEVLQETARVLLSKLTELIDAKYVSKNSKIVFVDDGSKDATWNIISDLHSDNKTFIGIKLSRNKGHQNALLAGLMYAKEHADISISMDADLQDDISVIDGMLEKYSDGCEIVYGVRKSRKNDKRFKKDSANCFYKLQAVMGIEAIPNSADCRLMSKKALEALSEYKEANLFLRGIVPMIGYKSDSVYYERQKRMAGVSKYPVKKMVSFAADGITSFSIKPLRFITALGFIILLLSLIVLIYSLVAKITGNVVSGWTFIICSIWLLGGIQTLCIGIIGEYVGKIYIESKRRPRYLVEEVLE